MACMARRINDQMLCTQCGLSWDIDDPEKPKCNPRKGRRVTNQDWEELKKAVDTGNYSYFKTRLP